MIELAGLTKVFGQTRVEWLYPVYDMPWGERG